jgi:lipopolysaccharide/colanic/teichoic acid biosynthesis glycosyltransferase
VRGSLPFGPLRVAATPIGSSGCIITPVSGPSSLAFDFGASEDSVQYGLVRKTPDVIKLLAQYEPVGIVGTFPDKRRPPENKFGHDLECMIDALNVRRILYAVARSSRKLPFAHLATQALPGRGAVLLQVQPGLVSPFSQLIKRVFDLVVVLLLIGLLLPLCVVVSLLIALDGGPIFFARECVGRGGRVFKCLKFRTMVPNAANALDQVLACPRAREERSRTRKLENDPGTTRFGTVLRASSIDQLPQLINVLRGDMSLVGPRPVVHQELRERYKADNSYYLPVRPGLTGPWRISGRNHINNEQRVHLDSWYVRNWTLWGDMIILFRTIPVVMSGHRAF